MVSFIFKVVENIGKKRRKCCLPAYPPYSEQEPHMLVMLGCLQIQNVSFCLRTMMTMTTQITPRLSNTSFSLNPFLHILTLKEKALRKNCGKRSNC